MPARLPLKLVLLPLLLMMLTTVRCALADHVLTVGILSLRPLAESQARWEPLSDYLSEALPGHRVQVQAFDYPDLEEALHHHKLDFILTHPTHYRLVRERNALSGALATLTETADGKPVEAIGGVIFSRAERNDLNTLHDLKKRTIATCSRNCMEGFQLPVEMFIDAGLPPPDETQLLFLGLPHDKVVEAVLSGKTDAGFARAGVLEAMAGEGRLDMRQLRIINRQDLPGFPYAVSTRLYPQWPLAALPQVDEASARRIAAALLRIEEDTPLARALDIHGFTVPASYASVEDLARKLRLPPYDTPPEITLADIWKRYRAQVILLILAVTIILSLAAGLWLSRRKLAAAKKISQEQANALKYSNTQLRTLIETIPDLIWLKDPGGVFLACNPRFERLFNAPESQIVGKTDYDFVPRELADFFQQKDQEAIAAGKPSINEEWVTFADDGQRGLLETIKTPMRDSEGRLIGVLGIARDITERRANEEKLRFLARVVDSAAEAFMVTDTLGNIVAINPAFTAITGYSEAEVVGKTPAMFKSGRQDPAFYQQMWSSILATGYWEGEIWDRRKDGMIYPKWLTITTVRDTSNQPTHYVAAFTDITERKAAEERIHHLAFYDPLTRLPNRRLLMDRAEHALASSTRTGEYGALIFLDLDHFKTLNDTQGHAVGDQLLIEVGKRLSASMREVDTVSRLGGDEFVLLLEDLGQEEEPAAALAESLAEKIRSHLAQPFHLEGLSKGYQTSSSIGLTLFRDQESSLDALFKQADLALYQAKDAGRNTLRFFNPAMQANLEARTAMESALRKGLELREFQLYYQPLVDPAGTCLGAEALLRWLPPGREPVSPAQFIPLAEETGFILPLGNWVLNTACAQLKIWEEHAATQHLTLSVNISARQFLQPDFVSEVEQALAQSGANPARLKLELTESVVLHNVAETIERMSSIKALGIRLSLDDFGTGYSSLSYLKRLPVEEVKIDRSFVTDIMHDPDDAAIVRAILALSQSLSLSVVAEGVETDQQLAFLTQYGCKIFQGYLFSRPIPEDEFKRYLGISAA
ncbi:MAG: EAL domain-containing protein [Sulfuricella sp.]|jgi:diguanylate cyclase (GGDEF)-like protein/PAS domain S-box-containing protein